MVLQDRAFMLCSCFKRCSLKPSKDGFWKVCQATAGSKGWKIWVWKSRFYLLNRFATQKIIWQRIIERRILKEESQTSWKKFEIYGLIHEIERYPPNIFKWRVKKKLRYDLWFIIHSNFEQLFALHKVVFYTE